MKKPFKPIYRIETTRKVGPYRSDFADKWRFRYHGGKTHPNVWEDFKNKDAERFFRTGNWNCGFKSKKQLKNWFIQSELKRLLKLGFKIVKIIPKKTIYGKKQVMFKDRISTTEVKFSELNY